jgi:hypothetical protein
MMRYRTFQETEYTFRMEIISGNRFCSPKSQLNFRKPILLSGKLVELPEIHFDFQKPVLFPKTHLTNIIPRMSIMGIIGIILRMSFTNKITTTIGFVPAQRTHQVVMIIWEKNETKSNIAYASPSEPNRKRRKESCNRSTGSFSFCGRGRIRIHFSSHSCPQKEREPVRTIKSITILRERKSKT